MKNKTGDFTGWTLMLLMAFGVTMVGTPMVAMAGPNTTVERPPEDGTPTGTVAVQGPCVINLTAPITEGACHLGLTDPPALLIVDNWYRAGHDLESDQLIVENSMKKTEINDADKIAQVFLRRAKGNPNPVLFWSAKPLKAPSTLDTPPGSTRKLELKTRAYGTSIYSKDELQTGMVAAIQWAKGWKNYRGSRFGK